MSNKEELTITGASDDLIKFDGSIYDEINEDDVSIHLPDGAVFRVYYDTGGIWRIESTTPGTYRFDIQKGDVEADTFDILTVHFPVAHAKWFSANKRRMGVVGAMVFSEEVERKYKAICDACEEYEDLTDQADLIKSIIAE